MEYYCQVGAVPTAYHVIADKVDCADVSQTTCIQYWGFVITFYIKVKLHY